MSTHLSLLVKCHLLVGQDALLEESVCGGRLGELARRSPLLSPLQLLLDHGIGADGVVYPLHLQQAVIRVAVTVICRMRAGAMVGWSADG